MKPAITLEEIGRRAIALSEARSAYREPRERCELADDDVSPCCFAGPWFEGGVMLALPEEEMCPACQVRRRLLRARSDAGRRLSSAVKSYRLRRGGGGGDEAR